MSQISEHPVELADERIGAVVELLPPLLDDAEAVLGFFDEPAAFLHRHFLQGVAGLGIGEGDAVELLLGLFELLDALLYEAAPVLHAVGVQPGAGAADLAGHVLQRRAGVVDVFHQVAAEAHEGIDRGNAGLVGHGSKKDEAAQRWSRYCWIRSAFRSSSGV